MSSVTKPYNGETDVHEEKEEEDETFQWKALSDYDSPPCLLLLHRLATSWMWASSYPTCESGESVVVAS